MLANAENNIAMQQTESVRFDELLWEVKDIFSRKGAPAIEIQLGDLPEDESRLYVKTNKTLLIHAVSNIVQNGLKFSAGQPVVCSLHFTADSIMIRITDKGIGIDAGLLPKIFEPFFRTTGAAQYPGHGVGLYIAKKIIELLGGSISVISQSGLGSTFNIVFMQKA